MTESPRFSDDHVKAWRDTGFTIIPGFFSEREIAPIRSDYEKIYGLPGEGENGVPWDAKKDGAIGSFREAQFKNIDVLPYRQGTVEMNLLSLHPAVIQLSRALLNTNQVHLYQSHTWAKYTGETDYDQEFHCDFGNHTLLAPADAIEQRTVDIIVYLTDVTDAHGALHYVNKPDAIELLGKDTVYAVGDEKQALLKGREQSAAAPSGTIVAHSIDTFHRGTNLTAPGGYRFTMTIGYKAAGNEMIGYHVWQTGADRDWPLVLNHASPEQLECLGIPLPGNPFWSKRTLKLTQARWPDWDMQPYFAAAEI